MYCYILYILSKSNTEILLFCNFRGILLQDQKRYDEAIESYKTAIICRPRLSSEFILYDQYFENLTHILNKKLQTIVFLNLINKIIQLSRLD